MHKKRKGIRAIISLVIIAAVVLTFFFLIKNKIIRVNTLCISPGDVVGVDISRYQGDVDMEALSGQNISFIYIKATEGAGHTDEMFQTNWANAKAADLPRGAYHFFSFESSGVEQARNYIETVGDLTGDLVPVVDVEYYTSKGMGAPEKEDIIRELEACLEELENYYHAKPVIYTSRAGYRDFLAGEVTGYPMWVRSIYLPAAMEGWQDWTIWQYTDMAVLQGYSGGEKYIDMNVLSKDVTLEDLTVK
ncbi:MAG: glycoside hydrolase family 25 [Lachnospiraceae bacterium]|nr:glycoside hydrolase family 25 [Lachnospiraceae bacterium]